MNCPQGHPNPAGAKFCSECGLRLTPEAVPSAPPVQQSGGVNVAAGQLEVGGDVVGKDKIEGQTVLVAKDGGQIVIGRQPAPSTPKALSLPAALRHYLDNLINTHCRLQLQAIRTDQPVSVELEKVYVSLTMKQRPGARETPSGGAGQALRFAQGERSEPSEEALRAGHDLSVAAALKRDRRLVITGDPGSGKTTLLAYLALTYARTLRDGVSLVQERLALEEAGHLPILLPLRDFG